MQHLRYAANAAAARDTSSPQPPPRPQPRVLVVEVDTDLRDAVTRRLTDDGLDVITASDHDTALHKAALGRPWAMIVINPRSLAHWGQDGMLLLDELAAVDRDMPIIAYAVQAHMPSAYEVDGTPTPTDYGRRLLDRGASAVVDLADGLDCVIDEARAALAALNGRDATP